MRILTWNINSVRLRAPIVQRMISELNPDVVCLQETKCPDDVFPHDAFHTFGLKHQHIHGMKSYNGVCILSRRPFENAVCHNRVNKTDCRHISVTLDGIDIHNIYIPAGGDIPDPAENDKFAHKLDFVDDLTNWFPQNYQADQKLVVAGDFNIAPMEQDVWSHKQLLDVVSHTPIEVDKLNAFQSSLDWVDAVRHFVPEDQKCYTWWSYRNRDWQKSNRGRRLDHIWVTRPLQKSLKSHHIFRDARNWDKPSDHVPVMVEIKT
ncbi:MAG: exodeoxyribonuclease III [Alphaproteobacteria bacterium]|nr:exodeoxyribonuclease III [Alphaproteobacteria bacterium]